MVNAVKEIRAPESEESTWRALACIEVRLVGDVDPEHQLTILEDAYRRVGQTVRSEDQICPMTVRHIAIQFGTLASGVLPQVLGDRLARAVSRPGRGPLQHLRPQVSVGMASPDLRVGAPFLTQRALAAAISGSARILRTPHDPAEGPSSMVTVDRLVSRRIHEGTDSTPFLAVHRRSSYRTSGYDRRTRTVDGSALSQRPRILVIDPLATHAAGPGLVATSTATLIAQAGCWSAAIPFAQDDPVTVALQDDTIDLAVIVLDGASVGHSSIWSASAWGLPSRLTSSYRAAGIPVIALSARAGAGAMAACVSKGAIAAFHLDDLRPLLERLAAGTLDEFATTSASTLPRLFQSLTGLTASERRVLFYLTEGWSAQDIADELVVSLTTVRSHIRSILRKLGVKSQLAAVAIANSRDLDHDLPGELI